MFEVEITIKINKFVRVRVVDRLTGEERVRVPQYFEGDWEEHARKVADEIVSELKREETRIIKYIVD
jgi:hypothetical protein